ncbi:hypothetical protein CORC01_04073 [Colletotrichum orchidophilum]|uniref:Uncharacterized protein n=1 Tax=Colletotrichum orchidophilum TaxID=1209926 RepID=A0A1G4BHE6_9PEZI|nr:uncharacterized protein CORC01_04073 [Colletotrichum orchidophilum]OHF00756.1 hypothetical protein CORC01_04073 [Colletotrichum orchidophilum]
MRLWPCLHGLELDGRRMQRPPPRPRAVPAPLVCCWAFPGLLLLVLRLVAAAAAAAAICAHEQVTRPAWKRQRRRAGDLCNPVPTRPCSYSCLINGCGQRQMGFGADRPTIGDNCDEFPAPPIEAVAERTNKLICHSLRSRVWTLDYGVFSSWAIPNIAAMAEAAPQESIGNGSKPFAGLHAFREEHHCTPPCRPSSCHKRDKTDKPFLTSLTWFPSTTLHPPSHLSSHLSNFE